MIIITFGFHAFITIAENSTKSMTDPNCSAKLGLFVK